MARPLGSKNKPRRVIFAQKTPDFINPELNTEINAKLIAKKPDIPFVQSFSVSDICRIIAAASSSNVRDLRVGDISITFGPKPEVAEVPFVREDKTLRAKSTGYDKQEQADFELAQLINDNPQAYEDLMIDRLSQGT